MEATFVESFSITVFYVIVLFLVYYFLFYKNKKTLFQFSKTILFPVVFVGGFILYSYGYYLAHGKNLDITNLFLSIYSSARLFILGNDLVEIKEIFHVGVDNVHGSDNHLLLLCFSLIMATVAFIFIAIFLNLFAEHISARRKIKQNKDTDANYIFWGINNASFTLAKDLLKNQQNRLVIFIKNSKKHEDQLLFYKASKLGAVIVTKESFFDKLSIKNEEFLVNTHENNEPENEINFYENNFLQTHKLIDCIKARDNHIFLFSNNEEGNTYAAQSIIHELETIGMDLQTTIYIRTIAQSYLEEQFFTCKISNKEKIKIQFINDAQIAAQQLILHNPPVIYVDPDTSLSVARKDFKPLILGFGLIGQACFRKLVEMGQFINSEFSALIVDQNMSKLKGRFSFNYPGLIKNYRIEFFEVLFGHTNFYDLFEKQTNHFEHFMYTVISLGDDKLNMQTAIELSKLAKRHDKSLKVFIHLNDENNYSHLLANSPELVCFGYDSEVFTELNIIQREMEERARYNHELYLNHTDKDRKVSTWHELSKMKQISNISAMEHQQTKLILMGFTEDDIIKFKNEEEFLNKLGKNRLENLTKTEHLRWNANYFVNGWDTWILEDIEGSTTSNEVKKTHACLVDWDALDLVEKRFYPLKKYDEITVKKIYDQIVKGELFVSVLKKNKSNKNKNFAQKDKKQNLNNIDIEILAKNVHNQWMNERINDGWKYGTERNDDKKEHPSLIPYENLSEEEKEYDRQTVLATIKGLIENGYKLVKK